MKCASFFFCSRAIRAARKPQLYLKAIQSWMNSPFHQMAHYYEVERQRAAVGSVYCEKLLKCCCLEARTKIGSCVLIKKLQDLSEGDDEGSVVCSRGARKVLFGEAVV